MNIFDAAWIVADQLQMRIGHGDGAEIVAVEMPGDKQKYPSDRSFAVTFDPVGENNQNDFVTFLVRIE